MGVLNNVKITLWSLWKRTKSTKSFEKCSSKFVSKVDSPPVVLAYHHFSASPTENEYCVSVKAFEKQINYYLKNGYTFLWQKEYKNNNTKSVIISIDDGWMDNYEYMFPLIQKYKVKVTINLTVEKTFTDSPRDSCFSFREINEMLDSGLVNFESHSMTHPHLTQCTDEELEYELSESKRLIKEKLNIESEVFVCPFEDSNKKVVDAIKKHYLMGYNFAENVDPIYSIRRIYMHESTSEKDMAVNTYYHYRSHFRKSVRR